MSREPFRFPYNQACIGIFLLLCLLMFGAYLFQVTELMGAFYFGLLILYRVVTGLVIKRYFWQWADEKVSFYSLLTALLLSTAWFLLIIQANPVSVGV